MDDKPDLPKLTERALAEQAARVAREAAALRANLKRRRVQAQGKIKAKAEAEAGTPKEDGEKAGFAGGG